MIPRPTLRPNPRPRFIPRPRPRTKLRLRPIFIIRNAIYSCYYFHRDLF